MDNRMNGMVKKQFAIDYNCRETDFENQRTLVTPMVKHSKGRKFENDSILSILSYNGKLVITAKDELLPWCEDVLKKHMSAQWGFESPALVSIDKKLHEFGHGIDQAHLFFLLEHVTSRTPENIAWLKGEAISALRDDERIDEAFLFDDTIEDVLGAALISEKNEMLAVAGASANSDLMWEIGCNSFCEGKGYGKTVVAALANEIYQRGIVPYTGTALSHIASQRVSLSAGFRPAFCELRSCPL